MPIREWSGWLCVMYSIVAALGANQGMVKVAVRNVRYRGGSGCRIMVL